VHGNASDDDGLLESSSAAKAESRKRKRGREGGRGMKMSVDRSGEMSSASKLSRWRDK
jgi:hypothetical protein